MLRFPMPMLMFSMFMWMVFGHVDVAFQLANAWMWSAQGRIFNAMHLHLHKLLHPISTYTYSSSYTYTYTVYTYTYT